MRKESSGAIEVSSTEGAPDFAELIAASVPYVLIAGDRIVEAAPLVADLLGIDPTRLSQRSLREVFVPTTGSFGRLLEGSTVMEARTADDFGGRRVSLRRLGGRAGIVAIEVRRPHALAAEYTRVAQRAVAVGLGLGVMVARPDGSLVYANDVAQTSFLAEFDDHLALTGTDMLNLFLPADRSEAAAAFVRCFAGEAGTITKRPAATPDRWHRLQLQPTDLGLMVVSVQDVTDLVTAENNLRSANRLHEALDENSREIVVVFDREGNTRYTSASIQRLFADEMASSLRAGRLDDLVHPADLSGLKDMFAETAQGPPATSNAMNGRILTEEGSFRWHECRVTNLMDDPDVAGIAWMLTDIHDRRLLELELEYRATHDQLTNLPDRTALINYLDEMLEFDGAKGRKTALLFCDVDNFKVVNDSLGHSAGDVLLTVIADRLVGAVRDIDLVARYGGDEFVIVAPALGGTDDAIEVANRVFSAFKGRVHFAGIDLHVGVSVGVAISEADDGASAELLLQRADAAMYEAKRKGRGRVELFTDALGADVALRLRTETELADAVEHGELCLHYQPVLPTGDGRTGVEALARWHHPVDGLVGPDRFIEVAEDTGFIRILGMELLRIAFRDFAHWPPDVRPDYMTVNMSPNQLGDDLVARRILSIVRDNEVDPADIIIEITESAFNRGPKVLENLSAFREAGARVYLDDFGTGYSSLSQLRQFPVDGIKIDRAFIHPEVDRELVELIVNIARTLGITTVAEGIETQEQFDRVAALGVDYAQGYLTGRPVPLEESIRQIRAASEAVEESE